MGVVSSRAMSTPTVGAPARAARPRPAPGWAAMPWAARTVPMTERHGARRAPRRRRAARGPRRCRRRRRWRRGARPRGSGRRRRSTPWSRALGLGQRGGRWRARARAARPGSGGRDDQPRSSAKAPRRAGRAPARSRRLGWPPTPPRCAASTSSAQPSSTGSRPSIVRTPSTSAPASSSAPSAMSPAMPEKQWNQATRSRGRPTAGRSSAGHRAGRAEAVVDADDGDAGGARRRAWRAAP